MRQIERVLLADYAMEKKFLPEMLNRCEQPQRALLIVFSVHAEKRSDLCCTVGKFSRLLLIFASDDLMQNVRRFRGRGFDIGQTLAVDQRRALGRFFLVALLPPHGEKNFAHDLICEVRKRVQ